jgi:small subunit ribosomal protein S1
VNLSRFEAEIVSGAWVGATKRFPIGSIHYKPTANSASFGVFVQLEPNLNGLIHASKLPADFRTNHKFQRGEIVRVSVLAVDRVERRVELDLVSDKE